MFQISDSVFLIIFIFIFFSISLDSLFHYPSSLPFVYFSWSSSVVHHYNMTQQPQNYSILSANINDLSSYLFITDSFKTFNSLHIFSSIQNFQFLCFPNLIYIRWTDSCILKHRHSLFKKPLNVPILLSWKIFAS